MPKAPKLEQVLAELERQAGHPLLPNPIRPCVLCKAPHARLSHGWKPSAICEACAIRGRERTKKWNAKRRAEGIHQPTVRVVEFVSELRGRAFLKLGRVCNRCGFSDPRALQIDHVHGGGTKEGKERSGRGAGLYRRVLLDTTGKYQLLCANCNWIKRYENGEHRGGANYAQRNQPQKKVV